VKEKRSFKRFDLVSALAVLGVLMVLAFESFFIFEFYRVDYAKVEPYLPGFMKDLFAPPPVPAAASDEPVAEEAASGEVKPAAPVVEEAVPATNTVPAASEEPEPGSDDEEPVPVG
jgi:hypothetical protein